MDFSNMKVLVIGDCCLDIITDGECTRISPEVPVPVIKNPFKKNSIGMAGNVALNLKGLGAKVNICTQFAPDDYSGTILKLLLEVNNLSYENFSPNSEHTIVKERIMANGHQIARIDREYPFYNVGKYAKEILEKYDINEFDFIVISDYNKGLITKESWKYIEPELQRINKNQLFFVDTKKVNVLPFYESMILFPNSKELKQIMEFNNCETPKDLFIELDTECLIETASENGAYAYTNYNNYYSPAKTMDVFDVCGAGDTFISSFSLYYTKFKNVQRALDFANYCCSIIVKKKGTVPITYKEVVEFDFESKF